MRSRRLRVQVLVALALVAGLVSLPAAARAQAVYGSIAGTSRISTGAALPGMNVTVTSVERQTSDTVVTNSSGNYLKERLLPGTYTVKAELERLPAGGGEHGPGQPRRADQGRPQARASASSRRRSRSPPPRASC